MAPKRSIVRVPVQPPAKKAKAADPIAQKISVICDALSDENIDVPCREMLKITGPMVLQVPSNTRHAYEAKVACMVEEVLKAQVEKIASQVEATTKAVDEAQAAKDAADSEMVDIQGQLKGQAAEVNSCQDQWKRDLDDQEDAKTALEAAEKSVADFDGETQLRAQDLENCSSALKVLMMDLTALPASDLSAEVIKVSEQLKSASADVSLQNATPPALQKKPEERGTFDVMAIEQVERLLQDHKVVLEERLQSRDDLKAERVSVVDSAHATMQSTIAKCQESTEQLKKAAQVERTLQGEQKAKEKALAMSVKELNKILKQQAFEQKELQKANNILSVFNFLLERDSASELVPEADLSTSSVSGSIQAPAATVHYVSTSVH